MRRRRPRRRRSPATRSFELLILDIGLPGQDGFAVLRALRARGERLPVLILTARDEVTDMVAGLDRGADDYVTKPFVFDELLARVRARLRQTGGAPATQMELDAGGITLDVRTRRAASESGGEAELTAKEFSLLETFLRHPGPGPQPRAAALTRLGLRLRSGFQRRRRLRRLSAAQVGSRALRAVRGMGYRLRT